MFAVHLTPMSDSTWMTLLEGRPRYIIVAIYLNIYVVVRIGTLYTLHV